MKEISILKTGNDVIDFYHSSENKSDINKFITLEELIDNAIEDAYKLGITVGENNTKIKIDNFFKDILKK